MIMKAKISPLIATVAIFSVFSNALILTGPLFMLQVYDRVLASRSEETLAALFILVSCLFALYAVFEYARGRVIAYVGANLQADLSAPVFRAVIERAALKKTGEQGSMQDLDVIRTTLGSPIALAVFDLPWTPLFIGAIFIFHPMLGWLAVAGGGVLVAVALLNQLLTSRKNQIAAARTHAAQAFSRSAEDRAEYVWAQGMQETALARFQNAQGKANAFSLKANDWTGSFHAFTKGFRLFLQSAMLAVGALLVLQQELTPGAMIAGSILLGRSLAPIDLAVGQWPAIQRARRAWRDISQLLKDQPDRATPTELPAPRANLEVRGVTVALASGDKPNLNQVSLSVGAGEALGVIGKSGSGKSTLARVLTGLIKPDIGEVRLGGATLSQYGVSALGKYVGYLPQDVQFFDATITENIAQLETEPDAARVVAAAKKARVHDVILALPEGYDTVVGSTEKKLSGGQRQRLALARALYNDPVLLILDEPNSALDAEGTDALNRAVMDMKAEHKSVIIMTHRPVAIQCCDNLLVLDNGRVSGIGPRDEVIKSMLVNADQVRKSLKVGQQR